MRDHLPTRVKTPPPTPSLQTAWRAVCFAHEAAVHLKAPGEQARHDQALAMTREVLGRYGVDLTDPTVRNTLVAVTDLLARVALVRPTLLDVVGEMSHIQQACRQAALTEEL